MSNKDVFRNLSAEMVSGPVSWVNATGLTGGTHVLRAQHTEIMSALEKIRLFCRRGKTDALAARNAMTGLLVLTTVHLATEKALLVNSEWAGSSKNSAQVIDNIDRVESLLRSFLKKFPVPSVIESNLTVFLESCDTVSKELGGLFSQEESGVLSEYERSLIA